MICLFLSKAYAMAPPPGEGGQGGGFGAFIPLILIFVIFYFLLIRPQQKKAKKHQDFLGNLKRDDHVVTNGGIHGKVTGITDTIVTLEIAPNVRIKINKANIAGLSQTQSRQDDKQNK